MTIFLILWAIPNIVILAGGLDGLRWEAPNAGVTGDELAKRPR